MTGASGALYARSLIRELVDLGREVHLIVSRAAIGVIAQEMDMDFSGGGFRVDEFLGRGVTPGQVVVHEETDLCAGPASGSFRVEGMVICPCSMKTLGSLASGAGGTLITRAADVCLKERRRLVVVPRETPLNLIQLRNMVTLCEAGAVVLPAMPGFYSRPKSIEDLADHLVMKIVDCLGIEPHENQPRWEGA